MVKIAFFLLSQKSAECHSVQKNLSFCFNIKSLSTFLQLFLRVYQNLYQKNYLPGKTDTENSSLGWNRVKKSVNLKKIVKTSNVYKLGFLTKKLLDLFHSIYSS